MKMRDHAIRALRQIEASAKDGIWGAHKGCATIAGTLLFKHDLVHSDAKVQIEQRIGSLLSVEHALPVKTVAMSRSSFTEKLLAKIAIGATEPKEIGHDVIYSAYVIRALAVFEIDPWESLLESLTTLVKKIKDSGPGWITVNGKNELRSLSEAAEQRGMDYWEMFVQFERSASAEAGDMQLGHLLTHGHAIEMLKSHATKSLVADLDLAYRKRIYGLRAAALEERDQPALPRRSIDPREKKYFVAADSFGDMHGHVLKYAYSFLDLRRTSIPKADLEAYGRIVWPDQPSSTF